MDLEVEVDVSRIKVEENGDDHFEDPLAPVNAITINKNCDNKTNEFENVPCARTKSEYDLNLRVYIKNGNGTYSCVRCAKEFTGRRVAVQHYNNDHSREPFTCHICDEKLKSIKSYKGHIDRKHSRKFVCPQCDKGFGQVSYFKTHFIVHLPKEERPFPCKTCGKRFTQAGALKIHMKLHAGIKDYYCRYCGRAFRDLGNMVNHERIHSKVKPYKCKDCDKAFSDPSAFKRHVRTHTHEMKYFCKYCPKKFTDASGLIAHQVRHSKPKLSCTLCNGKFYITNQLKKHMDAVHRGIKRFECHHCGHKSYTKGNLALHIIRVHTEASKKAPKVLVTCAHCGIATNSKPILRRHIIELHGKELGLKIKIKASNKQGANAQKFICDGCGNSYTRKCNLRHHIATHHVTLYDCRKCSELYLTADALQKHKASGCVKKDKISLKPRAKSKRKNV